MYKRIVFFMITLMLFVGVSMCNAQNWQQVDNKSWVDIDSIQLEHDGIIKATAREYLYENVYCVITVLVDGKNRKYCYRHKELYTTNGDRLGLISVNPEDENSWINYKDNNKIIQAIIGKQK